jgi:DnaJ homolog subfamily C member 28
MVDKNEDQIRRALEEGHFENLPGKGKPLDLDENPFEDPDWRAANRMLRNGGFSLPWIETRKSIEADFEAALAELGRGWRTRQARLSKNHPWDFLEAEWRRAVGVFRDKVDDLNRRIFSYNLEAPHLQLHMKKINLEKEIAKIKNDQQSSS